MERKETQLEKLRSVGVFSQGRGPLLNRVKIGSKTVDCLFIGYAWNSNVCQFLVHQFDNPEVHVHTITESDNAEFLKTFIGIKLNVSQ